MSRTSRATGGLTVAMLPTALVTALVAGCHSSNTSQAGAPSQGAGATGSASQSSGASGSGSGSAAPSPASSATAGLATCTTNRLSVTIDPSQAGGAAGSTYYPVDFTNTAGSTCAISGYPGVSFVTAVNATGKQIGAAAQRNPQFGAVVVRLAPGGHAHAWLQVAQAGNYPQCHQETARGLRVYPPDETRAGYVLREFAACADTTAPLLTVMPVRPGKGAQGSTP
jgi:hypothetical protein